MNQLTSSGARTKGLRLLAVIAALAISAALPVIPTLATAAEAVWVPVTDTSLIVREGSALDFSSFIPADPAGKNGPLRIAPQGYFEFAGQPGKRQKFWSASMAFSPPNGGFPSHQFADLYARQLRLHGYNMIRLQQVDAMLMVGRKTNFDFDPDQLDRFQYFLSALKAQGVYWVIDLLTSENGAYGGAIPNRWANLHSMKAGVYFDKERQDHWKQLTTKLLSTKNPYTGATLAADPALAGVILVNENGLTFLAYTNRSRYPEGLAPQFSEWLKKRYGSDERLKEQWAGELRNDELVAAGTMRPPGKMKDNGKRMRDFLRFVADLEVSTLDWMTKHVRDTGYDGPVTSLNSVNHLHADYSRRALGWIDMHGYLAEPSAYVTPGSEMPQKSSLEGRLPYLRQMAATRQTGKPFTVTEYGQPFWNSWRREAGLAVGAYGRLQDWDMICQYGENTIELSMAPNRLERKNTIMPFGLGVDPVARASETLAGLLFQRGDVSPSSNRMTISVDEEQVFQNADSSKSIPADISTLALLTGLGIGFNQKAATTSANDKMHVPDEALEPAGVAGRLLQLEKWIDGDPSGRVTKRVEKLRQSGVLSATNRTNADTGVFQSDTGEVLLDVAKRSLSVTTQKTEALSFDTLPAQNTGRMKVVSASGPALVALSSLDGKALPTSRRILGILATDAINTGMTFSDPERKKLASLGTLPARILAGRVVVELETTTGSDLTLYALKLNGERAETLPVERTPSGIRFTLDAVQPHGPTTFFELVAN